MGKVIDIHIRVASSIGNHRLRNHVFCQCLCLLVGHCQVVSGRAKNWLILVSFSVFLSVYLAVSLSVSLSVSLLVSFVGQVVSGRAKNWWILVLTVRAEGAV